MGIARRRMGWGFTLIDPSSGGSPGAGKALLKGAPAVIPGRKVDPKQIFQGFRLQDLFRHRALGHSPGQSTAETPGVPSFLAQLRALFTIPAGKWWIPTRKRGEG